jgi:MFS family permease
MSEAHDPYAALRYRDYRLLLSAGVLTSIGSEVQATAVGWEIYERTHDAANLGLVGLVQFLPVLLLALPAGHAADRYHRRQMFQAAQGLAALASLALAALSLWQGPVEWMFAFLTLAGIARAFTGPARTSLLAEVVPNTVLANAVTWNSSGWQFANVAGPGIGGLVIAIATLLMTSVRGAATPAFLLGACCSLTCLFLLWPIPLRAKASEARLGRDPAALLEGVRFVWRTKLLLAAITLDLFAVLLGGATALLPIYADDILKVGAVGLGALRAAPALGALVMAIWLAHRPPLRRPGVALLLAVAGFGMATIVFGFSTSFWLAFPMLALTGALDNISVVVRGTLMQSLTPDQMRGRVAAVNSIFISSSNELGQFESGLVAHWFDAPRSVVSGGIGTILVVIAVASRWPQLLRLGPLHLIRAEDPETATAEVLETEKL